MNIKVFKRASIFSGVVAIASLVLLFLNIERLSSAHLFFLSITAIASLIILSVSELIKYRQSGQALKDKEHANDFKMRESVRLANLSAMEFIKESVPTILIIIMIVNVFSMFEESINIPNRLIFSAAIFIILFLLDFIRFMRAKIAIQRLEKKKSPANTNS